MINGNIIYYELSCCKEMKINIKYFRYNVYL